MYIIIHLAVKFVQFHVNYLFGNKYRLPSVLNKMKEDK